ncbi:hypothetical protein [Amycolatopsis sp. cmx-11-51]
MAEYERWPHPGRRPRCHLLRADDVYASMDNGDQYFTDANGRKASVRK